jgi:hypothetical protein
MSAACLSGRLIKCREYTRRTPLLNTCQSACGIVVQLVGVTMPSLQSNHVALAVFHRQAAGDLCGSEMNEAFV